jgi:hypothetical protein
MWGGLAICGGLLIRPTPSNTELLASQFGFFDGIADRSPSARCSA